MAVTIIIVLVVLAGAVKSETKAPEVRECELLQYLTIGSNGTIQCLFNEYLAISWYNPEAEETIIFYKDGDKTGEGYIRGGYDVFPNGSLFIRNVSLEHEMLYRVTKVISLTQLSVSYTIRVQTVVKPNMTYPIIDKCPLGRGTCLVSLKSDVALNCLIEKTRPSVNLSWIARTLNRDQVLESNYLSLTQDNVTYTSRSTVMFSLNQFSLLTLLICKASSVPSSPIRHNESMVLIEKNINYTLDAAPTTKYIAISSPLKLLCNGNKGLLVWKQMLVGQSSWSSIVYSIPPPNPATESYSSQFQLDSEGSLVLQNIDIQHEGRYVCIHNDGVDEHLTLYEVNVYVNPVPGYPAVDGCDDQQYCVLHVEPGDVLTCGVYGIRPEVKIQWRTFHDDGLVFFLDQTQTIKQRGYLYDVVLTSKLAITSSKDNRVTVECRLTQSKNHQFDLSTTFDLLYVNVPTTSEPTTANFLIPTVIVSTLVIITIFSAAAFLIIRNARRRREPTNVQENAMEEATPLMNVVKDNRKPLYDENKEEEQLIAQLKGKYEMLYDAVQPIPYIKDRMYCVDKVFVEGGIEYLDNTTVAKQCKQWKKMNSYNELMDGTRIRSTRKILEGEPGYGKSTLTLQLVYDWCQGVPNSPLKQIKILILLRLRQLGGVNSISEAVRRFILPEDSKFTDDDVKSIIQKCSSVMFVLDGYDEYPDQNKTTTDVYKIIKKDIFRNIKVILTTRSSYLPNCCSPQTDRARLTGFDDIARDNYIRKAVTGDDNEAVDEIKQKLQENPVLGDLCEVPLFFVMFAHITNENEKLQTFHSVTGFFEYMISCFHSHMRNKLKDENVASLQFESNHYKLDEIAFNALIGKDQKIVWQKQMLCEALGEAFYNQYVRIGILVEEKVFDMFSLPDSTGEIQSTVEVRFYHKLFCEWYAAHHLANTILKHVPNTSALLAYLDPFDLQYVYRFACGLDKAAAQNIIEYLRKTNEGQKFAMLCILEQEGDKDELLESVTRLVSNEVTVNVHDSKLLQRSITQILEFASKKKIPISCLNLDNTFSKIDAGNVILHSGLRLPCPVSVKKVVIETERGREMTETEVVDILMFVQQSHMLEELRFKNCLLPHSIPAESIQSILMPNNATVKWCTLNAWYDLKFQSGRWVHRGSEMEMTDVEYADQLRSQDVKEFQEKWTRVAGDRLPNLTCSIGGADTDGHEQQQVRKESSRAQSEKHIEKVPSGYELELVKRLSTSAPELRSCKL